MLRRRTLQVRLLFVLAASAAVVMMGCAAKKNWWGDPETGLILEYRMPEALTLKYNSSNEFNQEMEMMGQTMYVSTSGFLLFSARSEGAERSGHRLEIAVDSMHVKMSSPQGELTPDMNSVIGKAFTMKLTVLGREMDLSGADTIQYDLGFAGKTSIAPQFKTMFPDMAGRPVKVGDTWATTDTIFDKSANSETRTILEGVSRLEGFETIKGLECARVKSEYKGKFSGKGRQGPMNLVSEGLIESMDIFYFAYKEGIFVKSVSTGTGKGTIEASGPQAITIPMKRENKVEIELIEW